MLGYGRDVSQKSESKASPDLPADPGILPRYRDVLIVPAEQKIDTVAITDFQGLMFAQPVGACHSHTGARLQGFQVLNPVQARDSAKPEVTVEREPQLRLHIIAQVSLEGADGSLRLRFRNRNRIGGGVSGEKAQAPIGL